MNTGNSPLVGRLILLVLSLILACLVVLVVRSFQERPALGDSAVAKTEAVLEESPEPIAVAIVPPPASRPPARRVPTNVVRAIMPPAAGNEAPEADPAPDPEVTHQPDAALPIASTRPRPPLLADGVTAFRDGPLILGNVTLSGTPPPEIPIEMDPACGRLQTQQRTTRHYVTGPDGQLANVFVYLKSTVPGSYAPAGPEPLLDQVDCMFEPYVLGVMAGHLFRVRNSDPILHNIHATPKVNREFNFAQTSRGQVNTRTFDTPELFVRLKCDVHPWMFAYVCVVPHPFHTVTDTNGTFVLPRGFPPGEYTVAAHHLRAGEATQTVSVKAGERRPIHLQLAVPAGPRTVAR